MQDSVWERRISYGLMAGLFGFVSLLVSLVSPVTAALGVRFPLSAPYGEDVAAIALFVIGILGILTGVKRIGGSAFAKPYDYIVGAALTIAGFLGIVGASQVFTQSFSSSLSQVIPVQGIYPVVYTYFGLHLLIRAVQRSRGQQDDQQPSMMVTVPARGSSESAS